MSRRWLHMLVAVFVFAAIGTASAQVPRNPPPNRPGPRPATGGTGTGSPAGPSSKFLTIPGLMPLSMEGVQREIGLTPEQKQQLKAVSDGYVASMQQLSKSFRELSQEDQEKQSKEIGDQAARFGRNARRKAETILSPQQFQAVERIAFQLSAAAMLPDPNLQEKIGLSAEQRQRLTTIYEQAGDKMQKLQRDTAVQVMQLLNDEQSAELKKQIDAQQQKPR